MKIWIEGTVYDVPECTCHQTPRTNPHEIEEHQPECAYYQEITKILNKPPEFLKAANY